MATSLDEFPAGIIELIAGSKSNVSVVLAHTSSKLRAVCAQLVKQCTWKTKRGLGNIGSLFPNLETACIEYVVLADPALYLHEPICDSVISNLPCGLKKLELLIRADISSETMRAMPHTLTHLDIRENKTMGRAGLRLLPPNLTYLNISGNEILDEHDYALINAPLTTLLTGSKYVRGDVLLRLPVSLTCLTVHINDAALEDMRRSLPNLITMDVTHNPEETRMSTFSFPASLKHLIYDIRGRVTIKESFIPEGIESLELHLQMPFTAVMANLLPQSLKKLAVQGDGIPTNALALSKLPKSLQHLDLNVNFTSAKQHALLAKLPASLETLIMYSKRNYDNPADHSKYLASGIKFTEL